MKRKLSLQGLFTNLILIAIILTVSAVTFFPQTALPSYSANSIKAIYNGDRAKPNVSLMFNVYENAEIVDKIATLLEQRGLRATFFVGGCWADDNGTTLNRLVQGGHEIANHGYFHKDHKKLSYKENYQEISLTGTIVTALCGVTPQLFAPPSGSYGENTLTSAYDLGYKVVMWSKDTIDWRDKDVSLIIKRATQGVTNGDLILMHPKQHTLDALNNILDYYEDLGLKQVPVSQNIC